MYNNGNESKKQELDTETKEDVLIKDNEMNERINKLFGESRIEEKKKLEDYDPNELADARKKLLFLFVIVIIAGIVIILLLMKPLDFNTPNNKDNGEENNGGNNVQNQNYPIELELFDEDVVVLNEKITFSSNDFKEIDLYPLYINKELNVKDIPNNLKLFLLSNDDEFYSMLVNNGVKEYVNTCNEKGIEISKSDFDEVINSNFRSDTTINYDTINYAFSIDGYNTKGIILTYKDDKYIVKCSNNTASNSITKFLQQKLVKAFAIEDGIELYQRVVFVSLEGNAGVYKEPTFDTLITNDKSAELDSYINNGNTYKYTFVKDKDNYYLSKIELIEEDN